MRTRRRLPIASMLVALSCAAGCGLVLGLGPLEYDSPVDAAVDAGDTSRETSEVPDAPVDAAAVPFADPNRWTGYATTQLQGGQYQAGVFDDRYVYFYRVSDKFRARVVRYDTAAPFNVETSWAAVDLGSLSTPSPGSSRAITFERPYLVLPAYRAINVLPDGAVTTPSSGRFLRFDTRRPAADFADPAAWELFDTRTVIPSATEFSGGAVIDGAAYYTPWQLGTGVVLSHIGEAFDAGWTVFDPPSDAGQCFQNQGVGCLGQQLLLGAQNAQCFARLDLRQGFEDASGPESFTLDASSSAGYLGTITTPTHVYFTQLSRSDSTDAGFRILRTSGSEPFEQGFELRELDPVNPFVSAYLGGTFDGRFVYFAPFTQAEQDGLSFGTIYLRYDTTTPFGDGAGWESVSGANVNVGVNRMHRGAVFDGQYVYYSPSDSTGFVVRFQALDTKQAEIWRPCSSF